MPAEIRDGALFDAHEGLDDGKYIVRIAAGMTTSWDSGTGQSIELPVPRHELAFVVVGSAPQEVRASTGGSWAARPSVEIPVVDWRDQPTAEAAWEAYLNGNRISLDAYGIFSPKHLMRNQRDTALEILGSEGYSIPRTPEPAETPGTWLGAVRGQPLGRILVGLAPVRRGGDRDQPGRLLIRQELDRHNNSPKIENNDPRRLRRSITPGQSTKQASERLAHDLTRMFLKPLNAASAAGARAAPPWPLRPLGAGHGAGRDRAGPSRMQMDVISACMKELRVEARWRCERDSSLRQGSVSHTRVGWFPMTLAGWYDVTEFGATSNFDPVTGEIQDKQETGGANLRAFKEALKAAKANLGNTNKMATVYANGHFYLGDTLEVVNGITLQGNGASKSGATDTRSASGTILAFPPDRTGIWFHYAPSPEIPTAGYSQIHDMEIRSTAWPAFTSSTGDGIEINCPVYMRNVHATGFARHGIYAPSGLNVGQLDGSRFDWVWCTENGADGFHFKGIDSQVCCFTSCSGFLNRRYGFYDNSHGNQFISCHGEANCVVFGALQNPPQTPRTGSITAGTNRLVVNTAAELAAGQYLAIDGVVADAGTSIDTTRDSRKVKFSSATGLRVGQAITIAGVAGKPVIVTLADDGNGELDTANGLTTQSGAKVYCNAIFRINEIVDQTTIKLDANAETSVDNKAVYYFALGKPTEPILQDAYAAGNWHIFPPLGGDSSILIGCWNEGSGGPGYSYFSRHVQILGGGWDQKAIHPQSSPFLLTDNGLSRRAPFRYVNERGTTTIESMIGTHGGVYGYTFGDMVAQQWSTGIGTDYQRLQYFNGPEQYSKWWCLVGNDPTHNQFIRYPSADANARAPAPWCHNGIFFGNSQPAETQVLILAAASVPTTQRNGVAKTYEVGDTVWNSEASPGSVLGWKCTVAGTQGTLNSDHTTADTQAGLRQVVVNETTGLAVGQYISIKDLTDNPRKIESIDKVTRTVTWGTAYAPANLTKSAAKVSFRNATFETFGRVDSGGYFTLADQTTPGGSPANAVWLWVDGTDGALRARTKAGITSSLTNGGTGTQAMGDADRTPAASVHQCGVIVTTGTLTAVRQLTLPQATDANAYGKWIDNTCTGAFSVVVRQPTGATVSVPNGTKAYVWLDSRGVTKLM
ncbi:hypothetical protein Sros01_82500 [Streptomyces roseochromogenus]|nr:hypothetical protein Sros01_82500 [Streptomyces roseochromogenus]